MIVIDNSKDITDNIIILNDLGIFIGSPSKDEMQTTLTDLRDEGNVEGARAILSKFNYIPYDAIKKVQSNVKSEMVYIKHRKGSQIRSRSISCYDQTTAERVVTSFSKMLPNTKHTEVQLSPVRSAVKPSIYLIAFLAMSSFLYNLAGADDVTISGANRGTKHLFLGIANILGTTGTLILGSVLVLFCVWWLVKRVKNPPLMLTWRQ